jgi:NAD-dependent SIR2 family protein deacetylase
MSLSRCTECETIEGNWEDNEDGIPVCQDCGAEDSLSIIPEHDDMDMER